MTDLKAVATIDMGLPGKLLWMLHLQTQAFLRTCSEINGDTFDTSILDWDRELTSIAQGLGGTSLGTIPPFLRHQQQGRGTTGTGGITGEDCVNRRILWGFAKGKASGSWRTSYRETNGHRNWRSDGCVCISTSSGSARGELDARKCTHTSHRMRGMQKKLKIGLRT